MTLADDSWHRARLALALLAVDPIGLGGAIVRMRACPQRETLLDALTAFPLPLQKIHPNIADEQLFGGIDISATLSSSQIIDFKGVLSQPSALILTMAERCPPALAGKLAMALDTMQKHCLIALDEGAEDDEACPPALADRLAFHINPEGRMPSEATLVPAGTQPVNIAHVTLDTDAISALATLATQLGIDSLRGHCSP